MRIRSNSATAALFFWACVMVALCCTGRATAASGRFVDFNREIRPILSDNCFACHGPDENKRKAKLRLDIPEGAFKETKGHAAIKPKDLNGSELWRRVTTKDPDDLMPPADSNRKLKPEQIAVLKRWIEQGANYKGHWAFNPPVRPDMPKTKDAAWPRNSIDHFIEAKLEANKLSHSPEANRETLIRRVTFDLTGLPPTLPEVDEFLADKQPGAYERLVDRLLKSPRYGEHMARYWLDAARYGDTHGLHLDNERSVWPYRDWVVTAFNRNEPFDQFTIEQIAGDQLPNPTREQQIASGFNRCNVTTSEGGAITEEFLFRYAVDRTETMSEVWMGLTAGCAVCHDHKFDPITSKDFYSLYAFYNSAADPGMDGNSLLTPPILKLTTPSQQKDLDKFDAEISALNKNISDEVAKVEYSDPATNEPAPPKKTVESVWVDDEFPKDTKAQWNEDTPETQWITEKDGPVFSGSRALKRTATAIAQDFFEGLKSPFVMPAKGKIFTYAYLDPDHPPKTIMLQFNTGGKWTHRAVWGDIDAIDFGEKDTMSRKSIGPLPKTGEWTRLEFDASKLSLKAGTKIEGLAFTLYGGTVYWDKTGVQWDSDPANDPLLSLAVWEKENWGKAPKDYPKEITDILKKEKKDEITPGQERKLREYYLENICNTTRPAFETLRQKLNPVQEKRAELDKSIIATLIMKDLDKPRDSFIMVRGQYNRPGEPVRPNVPGFLPELPAGETTNRLALAKWLTDRKHPLTARVAINRFWQQFFGTGIVKTAADFGSQGEPPSHPELLDWMATEFMDSGWDVKKMVKLMVTSATYRQDSKVLPKHLQLDPYNRLLAHGPRFRLDGEELRDNALFVSGLLNPAIGGKPVRPYQPENIWEPVAYTGSNTKTYKQDSGDSLYRRSLYTFWKRTAPPPSMTTFDAPSREQFCVRRERSNTPLQALVLMNDIQHFEAARAFAQRMMTEGGATAEDRLVYGFRTLTSRLPTPGEKSVIQKAYQQQLARFLADKEDAKKVIHNGESKPTAGIDESELAAYTLVASMMLNLDETVTRN